jgi:hypothetical protein
MRLLPLITVHCSLITCLSALSPTGGQRGTDIPVTLTEDHIASFQELITYRPGLTLADLKPDPANNKLATAILRIAPDAPLGEHPVRIRTAHGVSYLRTFWVGPFPVLKETEGAPQRVNLNTTIEGVITLEDVDEFTVPLTKGQRLSVEAEAMRLGRILFDAHLSIIGPNGSELASRDDAPLFKTDPYLSLIAPDDGDYRILIREAAYEGSDQSTYRLHIGSHPRPHMTFPLGGKPGEALNFTLIGDPTGVFTQPTTLSSDPSFPLFPTLNGETSPSPIPVLISTLEHSPQPDGNIDYKAAHPFPPIPSAVDGILDEKSDSRWFRFTAKKDQNLDIKVIARSMRSPLDAVLNLHDGANKFLLNNDDDGTSPDSLIKWTCPADGDYILRLRDQLGRTGPDFVFRIEINDRQPLIAASLPVAERNDSQKGKFFTIPQGGRHAAVIQLKRENIRCGFTFAAQSLPPGVRLIVPDAIPESLTNFPVIFEAAPDAPLGATLQGFTVTATGEKPLTAPLTDAIHLIEVNNEGTYHTVQTDRIPTAVTSPLPFTIAVDAPPTAIVRNGKLMLKLRATRSEGFQGKITARLPWFPTGISGPVNIEIPPEKTEVEYELNASADAATGNWQICVIGDSDTPQGNRAAASGFVQLTVAEPYLTIALDLAAGNIGAPSAILAKIDHIREFTGQATAELQALPHGVTSTPIAFTKDQKEITFPLTISPEAQPGKTTGLLCKVLVPENGGSVFHQTAHGGTLRIDPAPKTETTPPPATPNPVAAAPPAPAAAPEKPLSRLEQLRQKK